MSPNSPPWDSPGLPASYSPPPAISSTWLGQVHRVKQSSSFSPAVGEGSYKYEMSPTSEVVLLVIQSLPRFQFYSKATSKYQSHGAGCRHLAPANAWALRWLRTQLPTNALTGESLCPPGAPGPLSILLLLSAHTHKHTYTHTHTHTQSRNLGSPRLSGKGDRYLVLTAGLLPRWSEPQVLQTTLLPPGWGGASLPAG